LARLPNAGIAIIDAEKLYGYILSTTHSVGRFKAVFLRRLGYSAENLQEFDRKLRELILSQDAAAEIEETRFGKKFVIKGPFVGQSGEVMHMSYAEKRERPKVHYRVPGRLRMKFEKLEIVVLAHDIPLHSLRKGDVGTIVELYPEGGVEVEFVRGSGATQALLTLCEQDIRKIDAHDLLSIRRLAKVP
jgi:hypothetical protein